MVRKEQIELILVQIEGVQTANGISTPVGLLTEESGLGLKRKLRKIQDELIKQYTQYRTDQEEVNNKIEDPDKRIEETKLLAAETFELTSEKAMLSEIEKIQSKFPYNFELIELIAQ